MESKYTECLEILVNPDASSGNGIKVWKRIKDILNEKNAPYNVHILSAPGQAEYVASRLTKELKDDCHILVVGGDGTLNETVNGIKDFEHTKLSCIRSGSGNDFALNMKVDTDLEKALLHILDEPEETQVDYAEITADDHPPRRFLISCGVGYDADICKEVSKSGLKKVFNRLGIGKLIYVFIGIKQIFTRKKTMALLYLDDEKPIRIKKLFFVVGMNHMYEGGGVPFCPDADPTDGIMDVCLVRDMPKWKLLLAVAMVYSKNHLRFRKINCYRCKTMYLATMKPQQIHLDGETPYEAHRIRWETKGKLRFVK
ncbi:MAG: YegS/Rv2252/BmrU family lipid kinase [Lachnospiraceae bacterium]|nr:YegS/Rv2252/BmrU family lipid kinase [Lachnospiraceae bacterium]